jgi:hypothetical protein
MMIDDPALRISVVWLDEHMLELRIAASDGTFAGAVDVYSNLDEPNRLAALIEGFPLSNSDSREFIFGPNYSDGGNMASVQFVCLDSIGHVSVNIKLADSCPTSEQRITRRSEFSLTVTPSDIDTFVCELRQTKRKTWAGAILRAAS